MSPLDGKMEAHIRPRFVELVKLQGPEQMDNVAKRFFSRKEVLMRRVDPNFTVTRQEFWDQFGIDINKYIGFFAEIGGTSNLQGAYFPTNKVRPIFTIKRSHSGKTWKVISHSCPGFFSNAMDRAWIEVDDYEEMMGDNFFDELQENAEKIQKGMKKEAQQAQKRKKERAQKVKVRNWMKAKEDFEKSSE